MGLLDWLFGGNDNKSSQRASYYYERQENIKKIQEARERWANTQKEMYRKGGTTALGLTTGIDGDSDEDTGGGADKQEQEEYEDTVDGLINERENLKEDIEIYKADKADAINHYANPE